MTDFRFKPDDFDLGPEHKWMSKACAETANQLLQAHLATLPRVHCRADDTDLRGDGRLCANWSEIQHHEATHTALLWGITELEKKECEHEPFRISCAQEFGGMGEVLLDGFKPKCAKCGVKLKSKWEKAE